MADKRTPTKADALMGEKIKRFRHIRGISQEKLAMLIGLSFQQVQKYENGQNRVSAIGLAAIAAALKVSIDSFYEHVDNCDRLELSIVSDHRTMELFKKYKDFSSRDKNVVAAVINEIAARTPKAQARALREVEAA